MAYTAHTFDVIPATAATHNLRALLGARKSSNSTLDNCGRGAWSLLSQGTTTQRARRAACASMPLECHQRANRHVHRAQFGGAAEIRQIDDEAGCNHVGADLAQQFYRPLRGAAGRDQ